MTKPIHPDIPLQKIACSTFLAEVPLNMVDTPEGADYIGYYGGNECYEEFAAQHQKASASAQVGKPENQK